MSQQQPLDLSKVSVAKINAMLEALNAASEADRETAAQQMAAEMLKVQNIGGDPLAAQDVAITGFNKQTDAIRQANIKDQPILRDTANFEAELNQRIREGRTDAALRAIDPLLQRAEDRTARRDGQQMQILDKLTGHSDKLDSRASLDRRLNMLKDLGLGAMIMFGN